MHQATPDAKMIYVFQERPEAPRDSITDPEFVDLMQWNFKDRWAQSCGN